MKLKLGLEGNENRHHLRLCGHDQRVLLLLLLLLLQLLRLLLLSLLLLLLL